ncbi:MAG: DUF177 domain-containing protein [Armatimonadota bacterium]|nr:DUF177 domain-containing protein [Armatimonadota bacterium]
MKLDLSEIARILGKRYHYDVDETPIRDETIVCTEPMRGEIDFSNTGSLIVARGQFSTTVQLECGRCLETFTLPVLSHIDEQFDIHAPAGLAEPEPAAETEEEEEPESLFVENMLDLTELIRQNIILATPIRPLCDEACKGICPSCGQNLNEAQCGCETKPESPLSKLSEKWKQRQSDGEE